MRRLRWDATDFVECLECLPTENSRGERFVKEVNGLQLAVQVWEYERAIGVYLRRDNYTLMENIFYVRGGVEYRKEKPFEYLLLRNCFLIPERLWFYAYMDPRGKLLYEELINYLSGFNIEISIKPDIRVQQSGRRIRFPS